MLYLGKDPWTNFSLCNLWILGSSIQLHPVGKDYSTETSGHKLELDPILYDTQAAAAINSSL